MEAEVLVQHTLVVFLQDLHQEEQEVVDHLFLEVRQLMEQQILEAEVEEDGIRILPVDLAVQE
jgi:hypothetical protein